MDVSNERKLVLPSITQGYTVPKDENERMVFELNEDGSFGLSTVQFYEAFQLLFSEEFATFIRRVNRREKLQRAYSEAFSATVKAMDNGQNVSVAELYDLTHTAKRYGKWHAMCSQLKDSIIERVSWDTWIDASRLYEALTGVPRDWLD